MELTKSSLKHAEKTLNMGHSHTEKNTYVKTLGLKRGKGIRLQGAYFRKLMVILLNLTYAVGMGVSNRWNRIWNGTMEWKMEWNSEHTQLQLTCVTGTAQSRLNYLVYL